MQSMNFCGAHAVLDAAGALFLPAHGLLAVADLHLEKGSACAERGQLIPPWDSRLTLARLAALIAAYRPLVVVALGDSFHDSGACERLAAEDLRTLVGLATAAAFVWVRGNHDPLPPAGVPGTAAASWSAGGLAFRHQAMPGEIAEVSGHFHPKARVATRVGEVVRPCFMVDGSKLLLPAFGAYTGGLDVRAPAISGLFPGGGRAYVLGRARLFSFDVGRTPPVPAGTEAA